MVSIRFDEQLETRVRAIADSEGISLSELIRRAVQRYIEDSTDSLSVRLADVIGTVKSAGGRAQRSGQAFKRVARRIK